MDILAASVGGHAARGTGGLGGEDQRHVHVSSGNEEALKLFWTKLDLECRRKSAQWRQGHVGLAQGWSSALGRRRPRGDSVQNGAIDGIWSDPQSYEAGSMASFPSIIVPVMAGRVLYLVRSSLQ